MPAATTVPLNAALTVVDDPIEQGRYTRWVTGAAGERLGESSLQLSGMYCAACAGIIERAIGSIDGVRSVQVSAAAQRATVCWDPQRTLPSALIEAVRGAGYEAVPDAAAPARALRRREHRQALWRLFVASFCAMQVMMLATPSYVAGPGELAPDLWQLLAWGSWLLSLPVLVFSAGPFFSGAWRALRQRRIAMEVPVALGVAITFIASSGATFDPGGLFGNEVYFDSLTMFVSFLLGARYLELLARHGAAVALESALACLPETAWRLAADGSVTAVSVHRLRPGDLVRVPVGQAFPADGLLHGGATRADESLLSGESQAVEKADGAPLVAGSINLGAPVVMQVQRVGADTRFEAIVSMMRSAMSQRPAAARLADRWAAP
ncbi:MAG: cation-translocating P-type ATPase, partial [Rubrivivax sp.]|nr:cation-translocating P-type ATPase [Rubrivivax sp.]